MLDLKIIETTSGTLAAAGAVLYFPVFNVSNKEKQKIFDFLD